MLWFGKKFSTPSPRAERQAWRIMRGLYTILIVIGLVFLVVSLASSPVKWKSVIQALIMLALGSGGILSQRK